MLDIRPRFIGGEQISIDIESDIVEYTVICTEILYDMILLEHHFPDRIKW